MKLLQNLIKIVTTLTPGDTEKATYEAKFTELETKITGNLIYTQAQDGVSS
jgi:hypothetical protein